MVPVVHERERMYQGQCLTYIFSFFSFLCSAPMFLFTPQGCMMMMMMMLNTFVRALGYWLTSTFTTMYAAILLKPIYTCLHVYLVILHLPTYLPTYLHMYIGMYVCTEPPDLIISTILHVFCCLPTYYRPARVLYHIFPTHVCMYAYYISPLK